MGDMGGPHDVAERSGAAEAARGPGRRAADESAGGCGARRGAAVSWRGGCRDAVPGPRPAPAPSGALADARGGRAGPVVLADPSRHRCLAADRTWVPAMVPWRATEDGFVTPEVLDWYGRFAEGQPGVLVVEATGIRDVPSGPLLRIGNDRFVPGLRRLVETVRERSGGRTRLFIQLIDFLAVRRRPEPATFFARFLAIGDDLRRRLAEALGDARWQDAAAAPEAEVRARLAGAGRALVEAVLGARELEALDYGYRERVTDLHLPHIRELPRVLPRPVRRGRAPRARGGLRRRRAALRARLHDGVVPLADEPADDGYGGARAERVRLPLEVLRGGAGPGRRRLRGRLPLPRRRRDRGRQRRRRRGLVRAALRRGPASTSCRSPRAASSRTPSSPRSARPSIRTPASRATSACRP